MGDLLQLPPVNGAPVFDKLNNRAVLSKLGYMTSVNIWRETVVYDELIINEHQKKDVKFCELLDEVRRGCVSEEGIKILEERVIQGPIVDKFEELLRSSHSPVCLFPTRKECEEFNNEMLNKLEHTTVEIYCTDDVDETKGMHKWTKKEAEELKRLNKDCNLTAGLEAVLKIAAGARVMHRNNNTSLGLVNPLPANFHYCAIDRNDEIINSNLTGICERLCAQRFLVLERIRKLPQWGNRMNKVGNASLRTEKGCGSCTKVKTFAYEVRKWRPQRKQYFMLENPANVLI